MAEERVVEVVKGDKTWFELGTRRGKFGIELRLKTAPEVEEFMIAQADGATEALSIHGRNLKWYSPEGKDLQLYKMPIQIGNSYSGTYHVGSVGYDPLDNQIDGGTAVNISIIRLVGISQGAGVVIGMKGPYGPESARELKSKLGTALRQFARDYLVPFEFTLTISSQEF
jgi:hypothetical protein